MLEKLPVLPDDPILGLMQAYHADPNPLKVDLGAGIYKDENGLTPIMAAVQQAQARWLEQEESKKYAPVAGFPGFTEGMARLLLGENSTAIADERVVCTQSTGGCGALRVAAGVLSRCGNPMRIWVPNPTWANHVPLLQGAGLELVEYPYYDGEKHILDFDAMLSALKGLQPGDLILLHACCHNPCGADLNREQWRKLAVLINERGAMPFIDIAYQGLSENLDEDAWGLRHLVEQCPEVVAAASCSKNFGLYRERVGAVMIAAANKATAQAGYSQLLNVARSIYSMAPSHGAALVDIILHDDALKQSWVQELAEVRGRIADLRSALAEGLRAAGAGDRFDYIHHERGMFSFLGLNKEQVEHLKAEKSIYMVNSSRINVAGLNKTNMDYVVQAIMAII